MLDAGLCIWLTNESCEISMFAMFQQSRVLRGKTSTECMKLFPFEYFESCLVCMKCMLKNVFLFSDEAQEPLHQWCKSGSGKRGKLSSKNNPGKLAMIVAHLQVFRESTKTPV